MVGDWRPKKNLTEKTLSNEMWNEWIVWLKCENFCKYILSVLLSSIEWKRGALFYRFSYHVFSPFCFCIFQNVCGIFTTQKKYCRRTECWLRNFWCRINAKLVLHYGLDELVSFVSSSLFSGRKGEKKKWLYLAYVPSDTRSRGVLLQNISTCRRK